MQADSFLVRLVWPTVYYNSVVKDFVSQEQELIDDICLVDGATYELRPGASAPQQIG